MTNDTTTPTIHSPKNLVTEDYEYAGAGWNHIEGMPGWVLAQGDHSLELSRWIGRTDRTGRGTHQCHHCGARMIWFVIYRHIPTGDAVVVGETCAERFDLPTAEFHRMRKAQQLNRKAAKLTQQVQDFADANPDLAFMADPDHRHTNDFVADVAAKLRKYGSLSDKQVAAVRKAVTRDAERLARFAEADGGDDREKVPTGRVQITGEVVSTKEVENDFGISWKMLVKDERGFKVWGTIPTGLKAHRGAKVTFAAAVEPSRDDEYFGFYKRPTKAQLLQEA